LLTALHLAIEDAFAPKERRALISSLALALLALLLLWLGATALLDHLALFGIAWLDTPLAILGSIAALVLAYLLFPAMTALMLGFFLDGVIAEIERRRYPALPPPRRNGLASVLMSTLRLFLLAVILNVAALPFYLAPGINLFIYYGLNGYLVGREYFELVALRRLEGRAARATWRRHRGRFILTGIVIAFLLSVPLVNLVAPLVAAAFMLHVFERLRRSGTAETFAT